MVFCDSLLLFALLNLFLRCFVLLQSSMILLTLNHPDLTADHCMHIGREYGYACACHCRSFACEQAINHLTNLLCSFPGVRLAACSTITFMMSVSSLFAHSAMSINKHIGHRKCSVPPLFSTLPATPQGFFTLVVIISCLTNPRTPPFPFSLIFAVPAIDPLCFFQLPASTKKEKLMSPH